MAPERLCELEKGPSGYGFHLHSEKSRPGQFVRLVEPDSPAEKAGLRAGDRLLRVCGEDVTQLGHQQVVTKIRAATERLTLEVEGAEAPPEDAPQNILQVSTFSLSAPPQKQLRPRLCVMKKGPSGFGFNLHSDKSHPGQYVRAVDPNSPAEQAGLLPKDRIIEVNGESMLGKQHTEVVGAIKAGGDQTSLLVVDPETEKYFQECHVTPGAQHLAGPLPDKVTNGDLEKENEPENLSNQLSLDSPVSSPEISSGPSPLEERSRLMGAPDSPPTPTSEPEPAEALDINMSLAAAKERAHQKRSQKKAPIMDWNKRKEVFSSL
ncbi:Na(+)/H(+) exchange regulatory cofactor NHE-RF1 [Gastrophryne carolinensis]